MKFSILAGLVVGAFGMGALAFGTDVDGAGTSNIETSGSGKDSFLCHSKQPTKTCNKEGTVKMSNDQCQMSCRCEKDKKIVCDKVADCSAKDVSHFHGAKLSYG
jgi:hypothetical protein